MEEHWTMQQLASPDFLKSMVHTPENLNGLVVLDLADGQIRVSKRQAFLNLFWFPILTEFGIPISKRHFIKYRPLNADVFVEELDKYYDEIMVNPHNAKRFKNALWKTLTNLYYFGYSDLYAYVPTLDIVDMAEVTHDKPMKDLIDTKYQIKSSWSTDMVEQFIEKHRKQIMNMLGTKGALKNESLLPYQRTGQLSPFQVPQTMYCYGVRTDINDNIVRKIVLGSALDGLNDIYEYAVESLSARKSQFMNKNSVRNSQYFGRRMHLIAATLKQVYTGDCGTTKTVTYHISDGTDGHKRNFNAVLGKFIIDNGQLVALTRKNIAQYANRDVKMRSPLCCRYRNGICEVCGGLVYNNVNRKANIGILAAIHIVEPVTQKILSAKHLIRTSTIRFILNDISGKILTPANTSELKWMPMCIERVKNWELGIPVQMFPGYSSGDVQRLHSDKSISIKRMSKVTNICLCEKFKYDDPSKIKVYDITCGDMVPSLSAEMLLFIRDNYDRVHLDNGIVWIPLAGTERMALFTTPIVNDSMLQYVEDVKAFFTNKIGKYHSCSDALNDLADLVYSKVSTNIVHLETALRAFMVTSEEDYSIPVVQDPENVTFASLRDVLDNRHVSIRFAYEHLRDYVRNPRTYTTPKQKSEFDWLIGYTN